MRFLICGMGSIGRRHLRNLVRLGYKDIVLFRTNQSSLPDDELAGFPVESDLGRALKSRKPDGVLVTNPTALHLQVAVPAARAGAHLLIEKPVSHSMEGINDLSEAVAKAGVRVLIGYQFRFHPGLIQAKEILTNGQIGDPISARAHWGEYLPDWHPWEDYRRSYSASLQLGGGVILTLSHPLDYLRWLLGEAEVIHASSPRARPLGLPVEEAADILLRHSSGAQSNVHLDYHQRPPRHDLEIIGSKGSMRWSNEDGALHVWSVEPETSEDYLLPNGFGRNDMFVDEFKHFSRVVRGEESEICDLEDGIRTLELAIEARRIVRETDVGAPTSSDSGVS